jgi:hypothetical protein
VHQFVFGTTFVRECSRQDNVLAATMPGDCAAEWPRIRDERANRVHIDHFDRCGEDPIAPHPSEHPNRVDEPQSVFGGHSIRADAVGAADAVTLAEPPRCYAKSGDRRLSSSCGQSAHVATPSRNQAIHAGRRAICFDLAGWQGDDKVTCRVARSIACVLPKT